jgi:hypothetical protein
MMLFLKNNNNDYKADESKDHGASAASLAALYESSHLILSCQELSFIFFPMVNDGFSAAE